MTQPRTKCRGHGEDAIFFAADKNRDVGSVSVGYRADGRRIRREVMGRTKQEVRDKLKALHLELDAGLKSPPTYTVAQAVDDWLRDGLDGRSERTRTVVWCYCIEAVTKVPRLVAVVALGRHFDRARNDQPTMQRPCKSATPNIRPTCNAPTELLLASRTGA